MPEPKKNKTNPNINELLNKHVHQGTVIKISQANGAYIVKFGNHATKENIQHACKILEDNGYTFTRPVFTSGRGNVVSKHPQNMRLKGHFRHVPHNACRFAVVAPPSPKNPEGLPSPKGNTPPKNK